MNAVSVSLSYYSITAEAKEQEIILLSGGFSGVFGLLAFCEDDFCNMVDKCKKNKEKQKNM